MYLTQGNPQRGRLNKSSGTPTTYTTTPTTLASQGGLLINIDSATGDIAQTVDGFIEDEKYGSYNSEFATSTSAEFDTAVTRTGGKTLKLSTLDATGRARRLLIPAANYSTATTNLTNSRNLIPIKPSTKYKISCFVKTNNVASNSAFVEFVPIQSTGALAAGGSTTNKLTGTLDWTLCTVEFTSAVNAVFLGLICSVDVAGNISDAWFDINSMTLEEVVEPIANSLQATNKTASIQSFTAVGSTSNIDQSLDPTFAAILTYTPPVAISETATNKQTFVPTKSKMTRIGVFPVLKGTGNWTVTVHDASNVVQASITIANASLTNGAVNYFNVPCNLTALGTYHFHVTSTVADGTVKVTTLNDLETVSYIQNYYKPTTNFKASQNNTSISISADEDGFLDGSVISLVNGTYSFIKTYAGNETEIAKNYYYSYNVTGQGLLEGVSAGIPINSAFGVNNLIYKISTILPINSIDLILTPQGQPAPRSFKVQYSTDNISYTDLRTYTNADNLAAQTTAIPISGVTVFYLKFVFVASGICYINSLSLSGTLDTSTIPTLYNYPTNKDVTEYYTSTLSTPTTSATYRATKWGFPAIEYSATEYQFLRIDTTAALSVVQFSEAGSIFTTVADGASLAISSTSNPLLWVRTNITANRIYASSNDYNANSDKDGSNKMDMVYQVVQP